MPDAPFRLHWFSTLVPSTASGRLLEVGCGNGELLRLLAARCPRLKLVGIDRSALQVGRAVASVAAHPRAIDVRCLSLEAAGAHLATTPFSWIVAMNVNLFWTDPAQGIASLRPLLAPRGRVLLGYEAPTSRGREGLRDKVRRAFVDAGLDVRAEFVPDAVTSGAFAFELRLPRERPSQATIRSASKRA